MPAGPSSVSSEERRSEGVRMKRLLKPSAASSTRVDRLGSVGKKLSGAAWMPPVGTIVGQIR